MHSIVVKERITPMVIFILGSSADCF